MILLDTDVMTLWLLGHSKVTERVLGTADLVATSVVSRIELLRGRFDFLLKASNGAQLLQAQSRLDQTERELARLLVVPIDAESASLFDRLRQLSTSKKIGRADMLIASIALAHRATLVTRNLRHFAKSRGSPSKTGPIDCERCPGCHRRRGGRTAQPWPPSASSTSRSIRSIARASCLRRASGVPPSSWAISAQSQP